MGGCINPSLGKLLHAYELKSLTPDETERFELHLLECDYCFNEVSSMIDEISALLYDDSTKETIADLAAQSVRPATVPVSFWRYLWPFKAPLIFRPAFIYALLLIALIPAYFGLNSFSIDKAKPIQSIGLYQSRSAELLTLDRNRGNDAVINFILDNFNGGDRLTVAIKSESGRIVYNDESFDGIDNQGIGRLYLMLSQFDAGEYTLEVINHRLSPPADRSVYQFVIR
jgi:hypothetical protein